MKYKKYYTQQIKKTSSQSVLHLYLILFIHMLVIKINICGKLQELTARKYFCSYFHYLVRNNVFPYQIASGCKINSEKGEATFNSLKIFTNITSTHSDQVVKNALI